ncbi:MAG: orotate phosphoribosyltransferase [Cyanobacteria bacterium P01_A01_bin.135]
MTTPAASPSPASELPHASQVDSAAAKQQLLSLFCEVAYKEGDFVLSSGQRSSYYINGKQVTLHPQGGLLVGQVVLPMVPRHSAAVAGLTLGADPIVTAVSVVAATQGRSLAALIVRKQSKGHGIQAAIEGPPLPAQSPVVVLEDVVTTGQSALKAVTQLRQAGYLVEQVIALVDRLQGGAELYQEQGLAFQSVFTIETIQAEWRRTHSA